MKKNLKRGKQGKWKISKEKTSRGVKTVRWETRKEEYQ